MSQECCDSLKNILGITAIQTYKPADELLKCEPYDVIALWHVIEHIPNALELLPTISSRLNPGGILVMAAPNPDSFQFKIMGRYWLHLDAPRHCQLIPMSLLKEKCATLGMSLELATTRGGGAAGLNIFGWACSFGNLTSNRFLKKVLYCFGYIAALFLSPIEAKEGKGSCYTMVFRKNS